MWVTSLLQYLTCHQLHVVGGAVHWSAAALALTRRLLPTVRGQGVLLPIGHCACPDTPPVASCQGVLFIGWLSRLPATSLVASCRGSGRGLVWHVSSTTSPIDMGDSWSPIGPSEDTPRLGRAKDAGSP
ncbi:hypothetical protein BHM03_00042900 [Ensete ventricosum]|nr:hypothetical protein BHM03_00042900 [Ensete ventricosum]